jgi:hypothetical protein
MADLVSILVALLVFAIIWFIVERFLFPLIGDATIILIIRLILAVLLIVWLLSFIYPGRIFSGRLT